MGRRLFFPLASGFYSYLLLASTAASKAPLHGLRLETHTIPSCLHFYGADLAVRRFGAAC